MPYMAEINPRGQVPVLEDEDEDEVIKIDWSQMSAEALRKHRDAWRGIFTP